MLEVRPRVYILSQVLYHCVGETVRIEVPVAMWVSAHSVSTPAPSELLKDLRR